MSTTEIQKQGSESVATQNVQQEPRLRKPYYEVDTRKDGYYVHVYMPGVSKKSVDISLDDNTLTITGTRDRLVPEGWRPIHREIPERNYKLQLQLNVEIESGKIKAQMEDGVLHVDLPIAEAAKPRTIAID